MIIFWVTFFLYAALVVAILYCAFMGLKMCFQADVDFGLCALALAATTFGIVPLFLLYWINVLWKRNFADELIAYLNKPTGRKDLH